MRRLLGLALVLWLGASCTTARPPAGPDAAGLSHGTWSRLPAAPIPDRSGVIGVWSGKELLLWGGASGPGQADMRADGAAYDPRSRRWRVLPPAPISGRTSAAAHAWTGQELIVWGGYERGSRVIGDGAAYNPAANSWRRLAESPLGARADAVATLTGTEVVIVGGHGGDGRSDAAGAAYDPVTDRWRRLPAPPIPAGHEISYPFTVWTGSRLMVWWGWTHTEVEGNGIRIGGGFDRVDYDPAADAWSLAGPMEGRPHGINDVFWTGTELVIPAAPPWCASTCPSSAGSDLMGGRAGPDGLTWTPTAHGPVDDAGGPALWTGAAIVRISESFSAGTRAGDTAAWDPATDRWFELRPAPLVPVPGTAAVWTGSEVLLWGDLRRWDDGSHQSVPTAGGLRFGR